MIVEVQEYIVSAQLIGYDKRTLLAWWCYRQTWRSILFIVLKMFKYFVQYLVVQRRNIHVPDLLYILDDWQNPCVIGDERHGATKEGRNGMHHPELDGIQRWYKIGVQVQGWFQEFQGQFQRFTGTLETFFVGIAVGATVIDSNSQQEVLLRTQDEFAMPVDTKLIVAQSSPFNGKVS